ncbi:hypothetical protein MAUB1S_06352 [Mycolicibacterium aubagnense]
MPAHAEDWDGSVSSSWTTFGNWNGGVPGIFSNVDIDADGKANQPVIVDNQRIRSLDMQSGTLSITGAAASLEVNGSFGSGGIVDVTGGTINISGGASFSANRGVNIDSGGTIIVDVGSKLDADVTSDGTFNNAGTVTGTLEVNGGTVNNLGSGELQGDVVVNGGALINDNRIFGKLTVNNGGVATNNETVGGLVTVKAGGTLTNTTGSGLNGGLVNSGTSINDQGGTITTVVNSAGTFSNAGTVTGTLEVNGGTVNNLGSGELQGDVVVNGGALINDNRIFGKLTVNNGGVATNNETVGGLVTVKAGGKLTNTTGSGLNGGLVNSGTSINDQGGTITTVVNSAGTFSNAGTVTGTLEVNGGTVNNLGSGELQGDVVVNGGALINDNRIFGALTVNNGGVATNNETVGGLATVKVGGKLTNTTGSRLNGGLVNSGTSINDQGGTITTVVNSAGTFANAGTVTGTLEVNGGTVTNNGQVGGLTTVSSSGTFNNISGGALNGGLANSGSSTNAQGGTITTVVNSAGTFANAGTVTGTLEVNGGTVTNNGQVGGLTTVSSSGTFNNISGGALNGGLANSGSSTNAQGGTITTVVNSAGTFANAGTVTGTLEVNGGTVTNNGQVGGLTTVGSSGTFNNISGGELNGGLVNSGASINSQGGTISTIVNAAGTFVNSGAVTGTATVNGGTVTNMAAGVFSNSVAVNGGTFSNDGSINGSLAINNGGVANNAGVVAGVATVELGGTLNNAGGQFDGGLVNSGTVTGALTATRSKITNQVTGRMVDSVTVNGGEFANFGTVEADVKNLAGTIQTSGTIAGTFTNSDRAYVQGSIKGDILNRSGATFNLIGNLQASSGFVNEGTLMSAGNATISEAQFFTNSAGGKLAIRDGLTIASSQARFEQNSVVDMVGNGTGDSLTVNGNLQSQGATYNVDLVGIDQRVTADKIVVNGNLTGTGNINFVVGGDLASGQRVLTTNPVVIFDVSGTNDSQFKVTGLPFEPGIIEYEMFKDGQDWVVSSGVNPNAGAIAGSLALINSMVGTVVNRPNSAFVGGLAYEAKPNECGVGPWSRGTGGSASISGTTTGGLDDQISEVDAYYGGYQGGADFQCFNIGSSGWDVAVGGFGGFNMGRSKQSIDETSVTADFNQYYGGVYASAAKGQFVAELQTRFDYLDYTLNSPVLGLRDAGIDATRLSASATASYAFTFGDYSLVPSAGASVSYLSTDDLVFRSRHSLSFENQWSVVGFGGVTLARSFLNADKTAAYRPFVTATVYSDFGAKADSTFYDPVSRVTQKLSSEGVGTFGEVSVGLDYLKILPESNFLKAHQLNATVRGDLKFSDRLLSGGGTVQLRLQF